MTAAELHRQFREVLRDLVANSDDDTPAIASSAGCDSNALLCELVAAGMRPTVVSFTLDDRDSRDSRAARENARRLALPFHLVRLPSTPEGLGAMVRETFDAGVRGKANLEVLTPLRAMVRAADDLGHRTFWTGLMADCHFGVTRSEIIRYRNADVETFDAYRRSYWQDKGRPQVNHLHRLAALDTDVMVRVPYFDPVMRDVFYGHTWDELNRPRQKEAIRLHPGLSHLDVDKVRSNLQLGDSGVAETLSRLVDTPWNVGGHRSTVAIYNQWAREAA